ncbi:hypothetical protein HMN09_00215800 [Mycena chlorophos]|uniref:Uncharacterized protein n=1 Tax=Mycena chlorophos TaxID=658473 RepID=A0A8H6TNA4_MYCCL|nr:hypothetical protein HMN09_00215800 [Mycena chlorophos]
MSTTPAPLPRFVRSAAGRIIDVDQVVFRHLAKNEKARLQMARKRAELKLCPPAVQQAAADKAREHRAKYREKNRQNLRSKEAERRVRMNHERYDAFQTHIEQQGSSRQGSESDREYTSDDTFHHDAFQLEQQGLPSQAYAPRYPRQGSESDSAGGWSA